MGDTLHVIGTVIITAIVCGSLYGCHNSLMSRTPEQLCAQQDNPTEFCIKLLERMK